jgi:hypothetical protein
VRAEVGVLLRFRPTMYASDNCGLERVALVGKSGCLLRRGVDREGIA